MITPNDKNPFIVRTPEGEREAPTTKVIIGNLPISYSNQEIEAKLRQLGCEFQSKMLMERDRDEKGGLTRWLTGRRFVYIKVPDRPLPEKISIGPATATLYHREQKSSAEFSTCNRCFTPGHRAATCTNEVVCLACKLPGHKKGHPSCPLPLQEKAAEITFSQTEETSAPGVEDDHPKETEEEKETEEAEQSEKVSEDKESTRATEKPTNTSLIPRGRSATSEPCTPKARPRSNTREKRKCNSPPQHHEKSKKKKEQKTDSQQGKTSPASSKPPGKKS